MHASYQWYAESFNSFVYTKYQNNFWTIIPISHFYI